MFVCLFVLFLLILFLGKLVFITSEIVHPSPLVRSRFTVCFSTFNGNKLPLMTLVDLYRGGPVCFQSNCQSGNLIFEVYISFVSNVLYSIFAFKQCEKAKGLGNKTLVLSLGVTSPPVTPVTELDLSLFFTRLCHSVSPLYTHFVITIINYFQLYFVKFTSPERQNKLCNHFVEGPHSSIKFAKDFVFSCSSGFIRNYVYSFCCQSVEVLRSYFTYLSGVTSFFP